MNIELLNSEGPILQAIKWNGRIHLIDEYKNYVTSMSIEEFEFFIEGDVIITDSLGRDINYKTFPAEKPSIEKINQFIAHQL